MKNKDIKITDDFILDEEAVNALNFNFKQSPFNISGTGYFIACVGENGGYGTDTIFDGFASTVETLIKSIGDYQNMADPLVYPILYCVRHSIELFLKITYEQAFYIKALKEKKHIFMEIRERSIKIEEYQNNIRDVFRAQDDDEQRKIKLENEEIEKKINEEEEKRRSLWESLLSGKEDNKTHDLNELQDKILKICSVDERICKEFKFISALVKYYINVDPKGDMFRYLLDDEGKPHFASKNIQHVDLETVGKQFVWIKYFMEHFLNSLICIINEYRTMTYTSKLSRKQIEDISYMIPKPDEFEIMIKECKQKIMEKYKLSSSEFDKTLKLIKNHSEFSLNMGREIILKEISDDTLRAFTDCAKNKANWEENLISDEDIIVLRTYKDLGHLNCYSEDFEYVYNSFKNLMIDYHSLVPHADVKYIIKGMRICGQKTFADRIQQYMAEE